MAYKVHRNKWKGVKWIDSPFSARRKALASLMCKMVAASSAAQIEIIRNTPARTKVESIDKSIATAKALISSYEAILSTWDKVLYGDMDA